MLLTHKLFSFNAYLVYLVMLMMVSMVLMMMMIMLIMVVVVATHRLNQAISYHMDGIKPKVVRNLVSEREENGV